MEGIRARNIVFDGILAYADRYILGMRNELYLLSIYGNSQSVNAILGAAAQFRPLRVQLAGEPLEKLNPEEVQMQEFRKSGQYVLAQRVQDYSNRRICHFQSKRVSYGRAHGIWYDSLAAVRSNPGSDCIVVGENEEEAARRLFAVLDSRPIPLLAHWSETLIEMLVAGGHVCELLCHGCYAYLLRYDEPAILDLIGKGISNGQLMFSWPQLVTVS